VIAANLGQICSFVVVCHQVSLEIVPGPESAYPFLEERYQQRNKRGQVRRRGRGTPAGLAGVTQADLAGVLLGGPFQNGSGDSMSWDCGRSAISPVAVGLTVMLVILAYKMAGDE
jgi:hypothetical protein